MQPTDSVSENTIKIETLSHDGRGIATIQQKTTFIEGALPDEIVTFRINQKHRTYNEAVALEILTASSKRTTPPCKHFGLCGGCSLQHMDIAAQMALKQQTLLDQLLHFGKVTPHTVLAPLTAQSIGYRRKARLGVKFVHKKNKLLIGFREKSSRYLADLAYCTVLHPQVGEQLPALSELIASLEKHQQIPQVEVAIGDSTVALVFRHLEPLPATDIAKLIAFGKAQSFHLYLQPNPPATIHKIWPPDTSDYLTYTLPDQGLEFLFHPLDFTQVNLEMNRLMVNRALTLLDPQPHETILDLFCGIGNFTLPIAQQAQRVIGIEGSAEMVTRAEMNAAHNHISNVGFYAANLEKPPSKAAWLQTSYDKILLDPPRVGAKEMLPLLHQLAPQRIVYISCNSATLARDAGELVHQYGYQLLQVGMMNMFPHTAHAEAIAVFIKP